jgi:hypothetical protein
MGVVIARHPDLYRVDVVESRSSMKRISMDDMEAWNDDWNKQCRTSGRGDQKSRGESEQVGWWSCTKCRNNQRDSLIRLTFQEPQALNSM